MRSGLRLSIGKAAYNASIEAAIITYTNWQYHDYYGGLHYTYSGSAPLLGFPNIPHALAALEFQNSFLHWP